MSNSKHIKQAFSAGVCFTVVGIVLRFSAEWLLTQQKGAGWTSVDEAARDQLPPGRSARFCLRCQPDPAGVSPMALVERHASGG